MEIKIVETPERNFGYDICIWRGCMCVCVIKKRQIKGKTIEEVTTLLKPYGITKDEATIVYNKINGGI